MKSLGLSKDENLKVNIAKIRVNESSEIVSQLCYTNASRLSGRLDSCRPDGCSSARRVSAHSLFD